MHLHHLISLCFFFNATATTEIYTLSLHDALPISASSILPLPLEPASPTTSPPRTVRSAFSYASEVRPCAVSTTGAPAAAAARTYLLSCSATDSPAIASTSAARGRSATGAVVIQRAS